MNRAGALSDFKPIELAVAVFFAFAVMAGSAIALSSSALDRPAVVPEIDSGQAKPVRVIPVLDLDAPMLKLGGKRDQFDRIHASLLKCRRRRAYRRSCAPHAPVRPASWR